MVFSLPCLLLLPSVRNCSDYSPKNQQVKLKHDMNNSKQIGSDVIEKSGQEVAKTGFGKTDVGYWQDAICKPQYGRNGQTRKVEDWAVRIQWRGRRETFNLKTS